jgi:tetratricopeptide (TPR) repeat protein
LDSRLLSCQYNSLVLDKMGNLTGALTYLDKVLAIDPKGKDALYQKGVVLLKLGNHTGAVEYYDKAKAIK